ncbi:MAG TPA: HAD-IA family hydrolase [Hyphomicrobiaceae bacterium]|jgi:2-haloalkanoic acid dehalogenase type II|nr:HAD-IA family hydrolase [Hyphomicrobiaceae bacterium]
MPQERNYDAVVFDLLTALIDSWTLWNRAAGSTEDGLRWRREYLALTYAAGPYRPYADIVRQAARQADIKPFCVEALFAAWDDLLPWPETRNVLTTLAERVPLGVVTNCSVTLAAAAVARTGIRFAAIVTAESAGFYKPRPEPYRAVLRSLDTAPARTLFVAGSAADVPGAKAVGMPVFWHNRVGLHPVDAARPDFLAGSLEPLLKLL